MVSSRLLKYRCFRRLFKLREVKARADARMRRTSYAAVSDDGRNAEIARISKVSWRWQKNSVSRHGR